ncbi:MAG: SH3 domain-containing protein [Anaerolineales bacterium]|nr:SH3 domain-containing protein [Anaerolineales bacterium]
MMQHEHEVYREYGFYNNCAKRALQGMFALLVAVLLAGCGPFGGSDEAPTPAPTRTPFPTFTPTAAVVQNAAAVQPAAPPPAGEEAAATAPEVPAAPVPAESTVPPTATATPPAISEAKLTVTGDIVNVRAGPAVEFELVGTATQGQSFTIVAKNEQGDWWQVCCINGAQGWIFGELAAVENTGNVVVAAVLPVPVVATPLAAVTEAPPPAEAATATPVPAPVAYDPARSSEGNFDPNAQYKIVQFKVLGLDENNGGIRDSAAQHLIFLTVLDKNGNGVDGAVVKNLVGEKGEVVTGNKGPGKTEITMYYEPFKLSVASDPSGPVTSQVSNQMGLAKPHLPDIVGKLGDINYEYGACPTIDIKCKWDITALHFSYEITFQRTD